MLFALISYLFCHDKVMEKTYKEAMSWAKEKHQKDLSIMKEKGCLKTAQCQRKIDDYQDFHSDKKGEKILVFISFSMPPQSLKRLTQECFKHHATLVLKGLKENSFKKTINFMQEHQFAHNIEINPTLFTRYKITKVPVFILMKEEREISRLSGNVSMSFASLKLRGRL